MSAVLLGLLLLSGKLFGPIITSKEDSLQVQLDTTQSVNVRIVVLKELIEEKIKAEPSAALADLDQLLTLADSLNDKRLIAYAHNQLGILWYKENQLQKSTEHYYLALDQLEHSSKNHELLCRINSNIGRNFQEQKDYERALEYYDIGELFCRKSDRQDILAHLINSKAVVHKSLNHYDSALVLLDQAFAINKKNGDVEGELQNINNMGVIHLDLKQYKMADMYFIQALKLNDERKNHFEAANNLMNLGRSYLEQGKLQAAEDTLKHALRLADVSRSIPQKESILFTLYKVKRQQGDYEEALDTFHRYHYLEDSIYKKGQYTELIELEAKYKVAQKERILQESQNQLLRQRLINTISLAALFFSIIMIAILIWVYTTKKRNEKKLIALNMEIDEQNEKIQHINQNLERTIHQRTKVIQEQNNQLREFAFMNSHNIRRPLSNILGLLTLLAEEKDEKNIKELTRLANESASEMDQIIKDVNQQLKEGEL